jgi:stage IV sporulation protein FB
MKMPSRVNRSGSLEIMRIRGVQVFVHWSVLVIAALILLRMYKEPVLWIVTVVSYMGVLLLHESRHMIAAQRRRYEVLAIELYPVYGITLLESATSRIDRDVIAWGGIVAQLVVAVPLVVHFYIFGATRYAGLNAVLTVFGFYSVFIAVFNLIPMRPLDGATAWDLIPALIQRARIRHTNPSVKYRSAR